VHLLGIMHKAMMKRYKRVLIMELAEYYGFHRNTVSKLLCDMDLRTVGGLVMAVRLLDSYKGLMSMSG